MTGEEARRRGRTVKAFGWLQVPRREDEAGHMRIIHLPFAIFLRGPARAGEGRRGRRSGQLRHPRRGRRRTSPDRVHADGPPQGASSAGAATTTCTSSPRTRTTAAAYSSFSSICPLSALPHPPLARVSCSDLLHISDGCKREQRDSSSGAPRRVHVYHTYRV